MTADRSHGFEQRFAREDPYDVDASWYERRKLDVVLAGLTRPRYGRAWEAACGGGHLARALVERCDAVLATDASPSAVRRTAEKLAALTDGRVRTAVSALPDPPPDDRPFDLICLLEVIHYLDAAERRATAALVAEHLADGGEVAAVAWRHRAPDMPVSGAASLDELDERLRAAGLERAVRHEDRDFVSAHWVRA